MASDPPLFPFQKSSSEADLKMAPWTPPASSTSKVQESLSAQAIAARIGPLSYLEGLNPEQKQAVETLDGPLLVLAGAGTGKTRVLASRIAHLLTTGRASPAQILALTFTNKAADEIKKRITALIGKELHDLWGVGTFHRVCLKILRKHAEQVGLQSNFTILQTDDQLRILNQIIEAMGIKEKELTPKSFLRMIDIWKNRALSPQKIPAQEASLLGGNAARVYTLYQARLKTLNCVDFGDIILHCISIFLEDSTVLVHYHARIRYILVDEYQDTNVAQYLLLLLLAQGHRNICCVGDDDQSIYGWRGAEVENILRFPKDFKDGLILRLERNYRSTTPILAAASALIAHNRQRLGKTLFAARETPGASLVRVANAPDSEYEAYAIAHTILSLHETKNHSLSEMAVLVRASSQLRSFEDRFVKMNIPYRVFGGPRFYERLEIRDALAYLRSVAHESDDLALERIINTPRRGLGPVTLAKIYACAREEGVCLQKAAWLCLEKKLFSGKTQISLQTLLRALQRWRQKLETLPPHELAGIILDESGYTDLWKRDPSPDSDSRLDNLKEFIRSLQEYGDLSAFLEHSALMIGERGQEEEGEPEYIALMTLHAAKGLEFDTVFLPGWEEEIFPHPRALKEGGEKALEEERRLAYVGMTRARKLLYIWFSMRRCWNGNWQAATASRFLDELPRSCVQILGKQMFADLPESLSGKRFAFGKASLNKEPSPQKRSRFSSKDPKLIDL